MTEGPAPVEQTVRLYRSEDKIQPRAVSGWFAGWRWALVAFTQILYYGLPWLQWGERQAVLFDLGARRRRHLLDAIGKALHLMRVRVDRLRERARRSAAQCAAKARRSHLAR